MGGKTKTMSMLSEVERITRKTFPKYDHYRRFRFFLKHVKIKGTHECWLWKGATNPKGYGHFGWKDRKIILAHVAAYKFFVGSIPKRHGKKRLFVCHNCPDGDNPSCVNPNHLWLGTQQQNSDDMVKKGRSLHRHGEANPNAKLTWEEVEMIKVLHSTGKYNTKRLVRKFGVTPSHIGHIIKGLAWKGAVQ